MAEYATAIAGIVSATTSAYAAQQKGAVQDRAAQFRATQMESAAGQERAAAQRSAEEQRRQAELALSRMRALSGGAWSTDPTIATLAGRLAGEGEYRALLEMYEGESRARNYEINAAVTRAEGKAARVAGNLAAINSVVGSGTSLMSKYWGRGASGSSGYAERLQRGQMDS